MKDDGLGFELRKEELIKAMNGLDVNSNYNGNAFNFKHVNQSERCKKIIENESNSFNFIDNFLIDTDENSDFISELELHTEIEESGSQPLQPISISTLTPFSIQQPESDCNKMIIDEESHTSKVVFKKGKKNKKTIQISED